MYSIYYISNCTFVILPNVLYIFTLYTYITSSLLPATSVALHLTRRVRNIIKDYATFNLFSTSPCTHQILTLLLRN